MAERVAETNPTMISLSLSSRQFSLCFPLSRASRLYCVDSRLRVALLLLANLLCHYISHPPLPLFFHFVSFRDDSISKISSLFFDVWLSFELKITKRWNLSKDFFFQFQPNYSMWLIIVRGPSPLNYRINSNIKLGILLSKVGEIGIEFTIAVPKFQKIEIRSRGKFEKNRTLLKQFEKIKYNFITRENGTILKSIIFQKLKPLPLVEYNSSWET